MFGAVNKCSIGFIRIIDVGTTFKRVVLEQSLFAVFPRPYFFFLICCKMSYPVAYLQVVLVDTVLLGLYCLSNPVTSLLLESFREYHLVTWSFKFAESNSIFSPDILVVVV